jgi:hypothetical protein
MSRTRKAATAKTKAKQKPDVQEQAPAKQPTLPELRKQAKELGLTGYSRKSAAELTAMIAQAGKPVQSPAPYDPEVLVEPTGLSITATFQVKVDGRLEIKELQMVNPDGKPFEPPNIQAAVNWLLMDAPGGYQQQAAKFVSEKTAEYRKLLLDQFVPPAGQSEE